MTITGTTHKTSSSDYHQRCKKCGKLFYFTRSFGNGTWVKCPYCGTSH